MRSMTRLHKGVACILVVLLSLTPAGAVSAGANTWTSSGPVGGDITSLALNPATPSTLYAGAYGGGVFKSTDGGASWQARNTG